MSGAYQYKCISCHALDWGGKYDVICDDCRSGHSAALLDAFYGAVPEKFANEERTAGCAAGIPLNDSDRMWLRGIRKAIFANHPLTRMTRIDEELGLYDDDEQVAASADTHPKDGDVEQAPLVSGAVPERQTPTRSRQSNKPGREM